MNNSRVLFPTEIWKQVLDAGWNGDKAIVKIFGGPATWVIFGCDPDEPDILRCVADLGMGFVEYGTVRRSELEDTQIPLTMVMPDGSRKQLKLDLERDLYFEPGKTIEYYEALPTLTGCR